MLELKTAAAAATRVIAGAGTGIAVASRGRTVAFGRSTANILIHL